MDFKMLRRYVTVTGERIHGRRIDHMSDYETNITAAFDSRRQLCIEAYEGLNLYSKYLSFKRRSVLFGKSNSKSNNTHHR